MTTQPNGVHHLALATGDIKQQIAFFTDVLGMELVAFYWTRSYTQPPVSV